ncbi:hypothetical protein AB0M95_16930 [Sphaerisporangium sp. NPDC051017]|uniref:hypothetical protein n=1 Tax=Sphaerisporangium sp. NPDC051017 TaxID=3154636 RepID=UPI0034292A65
MIPYWSIATIDMASSGLIVGAATLIAANLIITRELRNQMPETLAALPVRAPARTRAAVLITPLVTMVPVTAAILVQLTSLRVGTTVGAGRFDAYALVTGVVVVALSAVIGIALGRWLPTLIAPGIALFVLGAAMVLGLAAWLLPLVFVSGIPVELSRPSGWHLVYIVALVFLVGAVALLRHGPRPGPATIAAAATVFALGATVLGGQGQHKAFAAASTQHCERRGEVTYCAFPPYVPWIGLWQQAVEPVVAAVPPAARHALPEIRQRVYDWRRFPREKLARPAVRPDQTWGRNGGETASRRILAAQVAAAVTGLPWDEMDSGGYLPTCDARGQARTVVALWLAEHVERQHLPSSIDTFNQEGDRKIGSIPRSDMGWVDYGPAELGYARRLLADPGAERRIWAHWDVLTNPKSTVSQVIPLLGLSVQPASGRPPAGEEPCA